MKNGRIKFEFDSKLIELVSVTDALNAFGSKELEKQISYIVRTTKKEIKLLNYSFEDIYQKLILNFVTNPNLIELLSKEDTNEETFYRLVKKYFLKYFV